MCESKKYKTKKYIHFDHRINIENTRQFEEIESYVANPKDIALHSFLPFIRYTSSTNKYIGEKNPEMKNRPVKTKNRDIMYAGHLDNFIYKYYADDILNKKYNHIISNSIDDCVTAYRNNKNGKSNIDFAAEIINEIVNYSEAFILVGDFTSFFDQIDHKILKENLMKVLEVQYLCKDWFNVYKSITKYGYYRKTLLEEKIGTDKQLRKSGKYSYFNHLKEFRAFQREYSTEKNKERFGIPQGSAISAVFANVYAINFDLIMKEIADRYSGLYRRYSDDFILVLPQKQKQFKLTVKDFESIEAEVRKIAGENKIELQAEKTGLFKYCNFEIVSLQEQKTSHIDYLGFVFDGKIVKMRGKSPYKFYRKAYQIIDKAKKVKGKRSLKKLPYRKKIFSLYTDLGIHSGDYGNFISYAKRAQKKFDEISPRTENMMLRQIKNRKKKIEKRMGIRIHS